jgi:predicted dehydrogenase
MWRPLSASPTAAPGTIAYAANGDSGLDKERLEVFGGGRAAVLDDFRELVIASRGKRTVKKSSPDKGHRAEMHALIEAVRQGAPSPVPFEQAVMSMRATFAIVQAITIGKPVPLS